MTIWDKAHVTNAKLRRDVLEKMEGWPVPDTFESNSCTFVPDQYGSLDMDEPCHVHDWEYNVGGGWADFRRANLHFRRNLRKVGAPAIVAWARWLAVSTAGIPFFNWHVDRNEVLVASSLWLCEKAFGGNPRGVLASHMENLA
jgi:hypothetical protein